MEFVGFFKRENKHFQCNQVEKDKIYFYYCHACLKKHRTTETKLKEHAENIHVKFIFH